METSSAATTGRVPAVQIHCATVLLPADDASRPSPKPTTAAAIKTLRMRRSALCVNNNRAPPAKFYSLSKARMAALRSIKAGSSKSW
jgi:hypothetical protein